MHNYYSRVTRSSYILEQLFSPDECRKKILQLVTTAHHSVKKSFMFSVRTKDYGIL